MARFTGTRILRWATALTGSLLIVLALVGVTLQLATALDRVGKASQARVYGKDVLSLAKAVKDKLTVAAALLWPRASVEATPISRDGRNRSGPADALAGAARSRRSGT